VGRGAAFWVPWVLGQAAGFWACGRGDAGVGACGRGHAACGLFEPLGPPGLLSHRFGPAGKAMQE
jgi:hypothetical protein